MGVPCPLRASCAVASPVSSALSPCLALPCPALSPVGDPHSVPAQNASVHTAPAPAGSLVPSDPHSVPAQNASAHAAPAPAGSLVPSDCSAFRCSLASSSTDCQRTRTLQSEWNSTKFQLYYLSALRALVGHCSLWAAVKTKCRNTGKSSSNFLSFKKNHSSIFGRAASSILHTGLLRLWQGGLLSRRSARASRGGGFSWCRAWALEHGGVAVCGLSCCGFQAPQHKSNSRGAGRSQLPVARRISPDQGSNLRLPHWQADSLPLRPPGKPLPILITTSPLKFTGLTICITLVYNKQYPILHHFLLLMQESCLPNVTIKSLKWLTLLSCVRSLYWV